jgi:hypothetical protein
MNVAFLVIIFLNSILEIKMDKTESIFLEDMYKII